MTGEAPTVPIAPPAWGRGGTSPWQRLAETGEVDVMQLPTGERSYHRCGTATHHHHLVCRGCGRAVEIGDLGVDLRAARVAAEHGFTDVSHTVDVFGTCAGCAATARPTDPDAGPRA